MTQLDYMSLFNAVQPNSVAAEQRSTRPAPEFNLDSIEEYLAERLAWQHTIPARDPEWRKIPDDLPKALRVALKRQGFTQLYSHQIRALKAIRDGRDVVMTPPTASGKTLSAYVAILEGCMRHDYRCLSFYGLKALAIDQGAKLNGIVGAIPEASRFQVRFAELTGDTSQDDRLQLLAAEPHIIATTPDLIHYLLRNAYRSEPLQVFLKHLKYVLIDELHTYSSVYGANMAWLMRRLQLAVDRYGGDSSQLQYICLSATCGNPVELSRRITNRPRPKRKEDDRLVWFRKSGAAQAERKIYTLRPTYSANSETAELTVQLMQQRIVGITFCNSIETAKTILRLIRMMSPQIGQQVAVFYAGLDAARRRAIISQLESGQLRWIISTEALEAGLDLPLLDCCIVRGFPDTLMSFWQRVGRAGRKHQGLSFYIPSAVSVMDCYYAMQQHLLGAVESIGFNPDYPVLTAAHLLCAASESGFAANEIKRYFSPQAVPIAQRLLEQGLLLRGRSTIYAKGFPHQQVSFRGSKFESVIRLKDEQGMVLEELAEGVAYRQVYPGAIYRRDVEGQVVAYECLSLDLQERTALLRTIGETPLHTVAAEEHSVSIAQSITQMAIAPADAEETPTIEMELGWGSISSAVTGYAAFSRVFEHTCLVKKCLGFKQPMGECSSCPNCGRPTKATEITQTVKEVKFDDSQPPLSTSLETMLLKLTCSPVLVEQLKAKATEIRKSLQGLAIPAGYLCLWESPAVQIGLHTMAHQLMMALPLVLKTDRFEINAKVDRIGDEHYVLFYDQSTGGNGASEGLMRHLQQVAAAAIDLSHTQPVDRAEWLYQYGCPDSNKALCSELGLIVLEAIIAGATSQRTTSEVAVES